MWVDEDSPLIENLSKSLVRTSPERRRRSASGSIGSIEEFQEHIDEIVHDIHMMTTFIPTDPDELAREVIERHRQQQQASLEINNNTEPNNNNNNNEDEHENDHERLRQDLTYPEEQIMIESHFTSSPEKLGVISMAVLIFYNVSGGPFGIETTVRAGGNFYAILGFLVMPFVWSLQEALMTAELGTTFPEASGSVAWVEEAFGHSTGWMAGYLSWISGATGMR